MSALPSPEIGAHRRVFGVIGDPIAHSLSPLIHAFWYSSLDLDAVYLPLRLCSERAADDIGALARFGLSGINVTLPHKENALRAAASADPAAQAIGAANTLSLRSGGTWHAANTDIDGFAACLENAFGEKWRDQPGKAVLIGAGGAARAAAYCLAASAFESVIVNRTAPKAQEMVRSLIPSARTCAYAALKAESADADLVINATSIGHHDDQLDLGQSRQSVFLDLSYGRAAASGLRAAREAGWQAMDGLHMLIAQAAQAFVLWFGIAPDIDGALKMCRAHLRRDAGE